MGGEVEVGYLSKFEIEYVGGGKRLVIPYELGARVDHVYVKSIRKWAADAEGNGEGAAIGPEKKREIIGTLKSALDFLGIASEILD